MDLIGTLKPFFLFSNVFGLLPCEMIEWNEGNVLRISRKKLGYSNILFLVIVVLNGYFEVNNVTIFKYPGNVKLFQKSILKLTHYHFYLTTFVIFHSVASKTKMLASSLNNVNRLYRLDFFTLDSLDLLSTFSWHLLIFSCFYYTSLVCAGLISYWYLNYEFGLNTFSERLATTVFFTFLWMTNLFLKNFIMFTNIVRLFYKKLNHDLTTQNKSKQKKIFIVFKLKQVKMADLVMKDFVQVLHVIYMKPILCRMSWGFLTILHAIISSLNKTPTSITIIWQIYILIEIIGLLSISHLTSIEAEKTANYLHELFVDSDDPEIKEEIEIFSLQLQHRKVEFNVCGFFKLDFTLLYSMIGALTTYIIILMQFQTDDPSGSFREWRPKNVLNCSLLFHHFSLSEVFHCVNNITVQKEL